MLTLLVPNYNRPDELRNVVTSMVRAIRFADASDWVKICIVDDFSTEEISEVIESFLELDFFEFHVQREKCGNAETAALNALEYVRTDYVWLIGNDDEISEDSIAYLKPYLMKRLYYFILLNPVYKHFDGSLYMTLSATHEVLEYKSTQDLFSDFGFVTSTTTLSCQIFHTSLVRQFHRVHQLPSCSTVYSHTFTFLAALKDCSAAFFSRPIAKFTQNEPFDENRKLRLQSPDGTELYFQTKGLKSLIEATSRISGIPVNWFLRAVEDEVDKFLKVDYRVTTGIFILNAICQQIIIDLTSFGTVRSFSSEQLAEFHGFFVCAETCIRHHFEKVASVAESDFIKPSLKTDYIRDIVLQLKDERVAEVLPGNRAGNAPKLKLYTTGRMQSFYTRAM